MNVQQLPSFRFDPITLDTHFGGPLSKPHNVFTAKAILVPPYNITITERESEGNGWYGASYQTQKTIDYAYIVVRDKIVLGAFFYSIHDSERIKLQLITKNKCFGGIRNFINKQGYKLNQNE